MSKKKLSKEELGEDLCDYCPLDDDHKGTTCYGGEPVFCIDSGMCETAYDNYLENEDEEEEE